MTGLISLVVQNKSHQGLMEFTYAMIGLIVVITFIAGELGRRFGGKLAIITAVLSMFYNSDWAPGSMANNSIGLPSSDSAGLYWTYFVAKRPKILVSQTPLGT